MGPGAHMWVSHLGPFWGCREEWLARKLTWADLAAYIWLYASPSNCLTHTYMKTQVTCVPPSLYICSSTFLPVLHTLKCDINWWPKMIFVWLFVRICFTWLSVLCKPGIGVVVAIHSYFFLLFIRFNWVGWLWLIFEFGWWWLIYVTWGLGAIISARPKVSPSPPLQHAQHDQDLCSTSIT